MPLIVAHKSIPFNDLAQIKELTLSMPELSEVYHFLCDWFNDKQSYTTALTSGSTGPPKQIQIFKSSMIKSAKKTANYFQFKSGNYALNSLPVQFIAGKMMLVRAMVSNLNLIFVKPNSTPLLGYEKYTFDFLPLTPFQLTQSLSKEPDSLSNVKTILLGGGPVTQELKESILKLSATVYHGYGMTETLTHIAIRNLTKQETNFRPLPGVNLDIGKEGQLIINADHIEETIVTSDLVSLDKSGIFSWIGRLDNVINTGGVKVCPEAIEQLLVPYIKCECIIAGQKDERLGERVILILETETRPPNLDRILEKTLEKYQTPKAIYLLPQFIRTETLKVKRQATISSALRNI